MPNAKTILLSCYLVLTCIVLTSPLLSYAQPLDKAYIESFAKSYLQAKLQPPANGKIQITVRPIDPRTKIQSCSNELKANIPENIYSRNVNVKISCDDSTPWQLYLPAKVIITLPILIAKNTIAKGSFLNHSNVELAFIDKNSIRTEQIVDIKKVIGGKAKKRISKGKAIRHRNICLVCKGDSVTIVAKSANFTIKTQGQALSSGNINDQVRVKNKRSGKVINAKVESLNRVIIIL